MKSIVYLIVAVLGVLLSGTQGHEFEGSSLQREPHDQGQEEIARVSTSTRTSASSRRFAKSANAVFDEVMRTLKTPSDQSIPYELQNTHKKINDLLASSTSQPSFSFFGGDNAKHKQRALGQDYYGARTNQHKQQRKASDKHASFAAVGRQLTADDRSLAYYTQPEEADDNDADMDAASLTLNAIELESLLEEEENEYLNDLKKLSQENIFVPDDESEPAARLKESLMDLEDVLALEKAVRQELLRLRELELEQSLKQGATNADQRREHDPKGKPKPKPKAKPRPSLATASPVDTPAAADSHAPPTGTSNGWFGYASQLWKAPRRILQQLVAHKVHLMPDTPVVDDIDGGPGPEAGPGAGAGAGAKAGSAPAQTAVVSGAAGVGSPTLDIESADPSPSTASVSVDASPSVDSGSSPGPGPAPAPASLAAAAPSPSHSHSDHSPASNPHPKPHPRPHSPGGGAGAGIGADSSADGEEEEDGTSDETDNASAQSHEAGSDTTAAAPTSDATDGGGWQSWNVFYKAAVILSSAAVLVWLCLSVHKAVIANRSGEAHGSGLPLYSSPGAPSNTVGERSSAEKSQGQGDKHTEAEANGGRLLGYRNDGDKATRSGMHNNSGNSSSKGGGGGGGGGGGVNQLAGNASSVAANALAPALTASVEYLDIHDIMTATATADTTMRLSNDDVSSSAQLEFFTPTNGSTMAHAIARSASASAAGKVAANLRSYTNVVSGSGLSLECDAVFSEGNSESLPLQQQSSAAALVAAADSSSSQTDGASGESAKGLWSWTARILNLGNLLSGQVGYSPVESSMAAATDVESGLGKSGSSSSAGTRSDDVRDGCEGGASTPVAKHSSVAAEESAGASRPRTSTLTSAVKPPRPAQNSSNTDSPSSAVTASPVISRVLSATSLGTHTADGNVNRASPKKSPSLSPGLSSNTRRVYANTVSRNSNANAKPSANPSDVSPTLASVQHAAKMAADAAAGVYGFDTEKCGLLDDGSAASFSDETCSSLGGTTGTSGTSDDTITSDSADAAAPISSSSSLLLKDSFKDFIPRPNDTDAFLPAVGEDRDINESKVGGLAQRSNSSSSSSLSGSSKCSSMRTFTSWDEEPDLTEPQNRLTLAV